MGKKKKKSNASDGDETNLGRSNLHSSGDSATACEFRSRPQGTEPYRQTSFTQERSHGAGKNFQPRQHTANSSESGSGYSGWERTYRYGNSQQAHPKHHRTINAVRDDLDNAETSSRWYKHHGRSNSRYKNGQRHWDENPFRRKNNKQEGHNQSRWTVESVRPSSSESTEGTSSDSLEIPGFYYDPEKKKYFKILAGQHSGSSNMITRDIIKSKKIEEARKQSLREFALKTIRMDPSYNVGCEAVQKQRCHYSFNILDHAQCIQTGAVRPHEFRLAQHRLLNSQMRNLHMLCKRRVFSRHCVRYERLEHMTKMVPAPGDFRARVLCLWSLEELIVQRIQLVDITQVAVQSSSKSIIDSTTSDECKQSNDQPTPILSVSPVGEVVLQCFSKVTDVCWAPSSTEQTTDVPILYTTTCFMGKNPSLALLRTLDQNARTETEPTSNSPYTEFHLGHQIIWTCAWSIHKQKFSIGCKDSALVIDVATRRLWELSTKKSDVFSQAFSNRDGNTLYSGTKKGVIVGHDLRSNSTRFTMSLSHRSPVCHVHLLNDDTHLIAGDFSGRLCMWDLRMRSVVQDYIGHNNEYVPLPFKVDTSESLICAVGQDCYTRMWDLQTGVLLNTVPPPYPASRELIPSVAIYSKPHGQLDRPGLLMGIKDQIQFYAQA